MTRPSILIVDDEPNSLFGICQVLADEGFQTIPANNGTMAARIASAEAIMSGRNICPRANCSPTSCIPGTKPLLIASMGGMPDATASCARLASNLTSGQERARDCDRGGEDVEATHGYSTTIVIFIGLPVSAW